MSLSKSSIGIYSFQGFGTALVAFNTISSNSEWRIQLFDFIERNGTTDFLFECERNSVIEVAHRLSEFEPESSYWVSEPHSALYDLILNRSLADIKTKAIAFDANQLGPLLQVANEFIGLGWTLVESSLTRSASACGHVLLTSDLEIPLELMKNYSNVGKFSLIDKPSSAFVQHFALTPPTF